MKNKELVDRILKASQIIHKGSIKGNANYMVVSSDVVDKINGFKRRYLRKEKIKRLFTWIR
jgi:hypothetical protein